MRYFINMKREFKDEFGKVYTFDPAQCRENEDEIELMNQLDTMDIGKPYIFPKNAVAEITKQEYDRLTSAIHEGVEGADAREEILSKYSRD
ncbi:hypothetical protein SAMN05428981_109129 [Bacillus sp. OV194]|uniref:hypothetical protein n=1 Tax=Fictibacillus sp. B-59209 TaxID=3024873 RepID=UPI0006A7922E|nr:hypothetical protein [Fictibacillus sp. B-59209]MED2970833.1 hypothetical protein [Fictibacillus sp. B-59209]SFE86644.1 hypothetical protein SAMN05428981_109129 [Bacillus sp. OV194]